MTNELGEVEEDIPLTGREYVDGEGILTIDANADVDDLPYPWCDLQFTIRFVEGNTFTDLAHTQGNMFTDLAIRAKGLTTQVGFGGLSGTSPMQKMMGGAKRAMSDEYSRRHKKQANGKAAGGKPFVQQRVRGGLLSTSSSAGA